MPAWICQDERQYAGWNGQQWLTCWTSRGTERFAFDRVYGGWWGRVVVADGPAAIRRSADRYVARLRGERPGSQQDG
jgi:hypothetical protein